MKEEREREREEKELSYWRLAGTAHASKGACTRTHRHFDKKAGVACAA